MMLVLGSSRLLHAASFGFVYDELGRLVGVTDATGANASYTYDAAGNVVSIGRSTSGQVAIIEFTPNGGPAGTAVTISGTGFSATAGQNTVKFKNNKSATVTSATTTQLTVTVPAGATTGSIAVTAPNGTATSASPFTVGSSVAPTITSFSPTTGTVGTAVSITGTNFNTVASNDKPTFNTRQAAVSSATATSLATSVPTTGSSGKIAVTTPYGKAVSTQDFSCLLLPTPAQTLA